MTPWREGPLTGAAREQQKLWGSDPTGWARFAEPHTRPLFEAVLVAAAIAKAVVPFTDPETGVIRMRNVFRWVSAAKVSAVRP